MQLAIVQKLKPGHLYTVTTPNTCTITTMNGLLITTVEPGTQGSFIAPTEYITFSEPDALVTETFKGASATVSGGGGAAGGVIDQEFNPFSSRAQSGQAVAEAAKLVDVHVNDLGVIYRNGLTTPESVHSEFRTAATDEIWFEFGDSAYEITWPSDWIWLEGEPPTFSANTAYCVCKREERSGRTIVNVAYAYTIPD